MINDTNNAGTGRVGVISDTHGLLRPEALDRLHGCDHIIHGGDIGNAGILTALAGIAPLTVVRGNNDRQDWTQAIPASARLTIAGVGIFVVHDISDARSDPLADGARVVITGHSHKPSVADRDQVLYLNPGSAGPRRFKLPISLAELHIANGEVSARIFDLTPCVR